MALGFFGHGKRRETLHPFSAETFENRVFQDFEFGGRNDQVERLHDATFLNCAADPRTYIFHPAVLERVKFKEFKCSKFLCIDSEVSLHDVTVSGRKHPTMLWIKPSETGQFTDSDYSLDISEFYGEVSIIGVNCYGIRINPTQHYRLDIDNWKGKRASEFFPGAHVLRIAEELVVNSGATQAVYSIPRSKEQREEFSQGIEFLAQQGIIIA